MQSKVVEVVIWWALVLTLSNTPALAFLGFSNPLGFYGHEACRSNLKIGGEHRVGECYNELECVAQGGIIGGYCGALVAGTVSI